MKRFIIAIIITYIALTSLVASESMPEFPAGWKPATRSDYSDENVSFNKDQVPNHIEADFNGDGARDHAWILINRSKNAYGLFIFLAVENGNYRTIPLDEHKRETAKLFMGVSLLEPGQYQTACGKGHWKCRQHEPEILELNTSGINYFAYEGATSVFYWNPRKQEFTRIWLSD